MTRPRTRSVPTKGAWRTPAQNGTGQPHHYFASSVASWRTGTDLETLLKAMKAEGFPFNVYRVTAPEDEAYAIESYRPQLDDPSRVVWVGYWTTEPAT